MSLQSPPSQDWDLEKFVLLVERSYFFSFLFLFFSSLFSVYLSSLDILKVTHLVREKNPQEQVCVNAFAIFTFSVQFSYGTEHSK